MVWLPNRGIAAYALLSIAVERPKWARCSLIARGQLALSLLILVALLAGGLLPGCSRHQPSRADPPRLATPEPVRSGTEADPVVRDYQFVSERNVFRPLVVAPKGEGGGEGSAGGAASSASGPRPAPNPSLRGPTQPPDPTADLAITGITETTDGLRVLIEKLSTHEGRYAAVGDMVFGLTVRGIGRGTVTLAQGEKEYELKLGQREIATTPVVGQTTATSETPTATASSSSSSTSTSPFSGRTDWRNMSAAERQAAMEQRRSWWEGLSESERDRYRSGSSRGGDRGSRSGRGRAGPPGR